MLCGQDLRAKLLAEAEAAAAANATISWRWSGVLGHNVPQDMFDAIEQQRLACEAVIASKTRLIAGWWAVRAAQAAANLAGCSVEVAGQNRSRLLWPKHLHQHSNRGALPLC